MRISAEFRLDADPRRVFAMIVNPVFQEAKCVASGSFEHEVDISEHEDGSAVVISRRTLPTDSLPDFVQSFVGANIQLQETQRWQAPSADGSRLGVVDVEIHGVSVRFRASVTLLPDGPGARWTIAGELKASVPFIGGRIEKAATPAVLSGIRVEQHTGLTWLSEH